MSKYEAIYLCKKCKKELNITERCYSQGVCPYCGAVSESTFVECVKQSKKVEK